MRRRACDRISPTIKRSSSWPSPTRSTRSIPRSRKCWGRAHRRSSRMASHPLDNMIWNALAGPQAHLGDSNGKERRFAPEKSIFAAAVRPHESLDGLIEIIPDGGRAGLVTTAPLTLPPDLVAMATGEVVHLTAEQFKPIPTDSVVYREH